MHFLPGKFIDCLPSLKLLPVLAFLMKGRDKSSPLSFPIEPTSLVVQYLFELVRAEGRLRELEGPISAGHLSSLPFLPLSVYLIPVLSYISSSLFSLSCCLSSHVSYLKWRSGKLNRGNFRLLPQFGCFTGPLGITGWLSLLGLNQASMGKL